MTAAESLRDKDKRIDEATQKEQGSLLTHIKPSPSEQAKKVEKAIATTPDEQVVINILDQIEAEKKVLKAGGGQLTVKEDEPGIVTVKTEFDDPQHGQKENVQAAMRKMADIFKKHDISCTMETIHSRCPCPRNPYEIRLKCSPSNSR